MPENNFVTDTQKNNKRNFSRRFKSLLMLAIILTGIPSIIFLFCWPSLELGDASSLMTILHYLCEFCIFVTLIRIYINKVNVFKILTQGLWIICILFLAASFIFPRHPYYPNSSFVLLVFLDGNLFLPGILAAILACLVKEGVKMQTELDEIL